MQEGGGKKRKTHTRTRSGSLGGRTRCTRVCVCAYARVHARVRAYACVRMCAYVCACDRCVRCVRVRVRVRVRALTGKVAKAVGGGGLEGVGTYIRYSQPAILAL